VAAFVLIAQTKANIDPQILRLHLAANEDDRCYYRMAVGAPRRLPSVFRNSFGLCDSRAWRGEKVPKNNIPPGFQRNRNTIIGKLGKALSLSASHYCHSVMEWLRRSAIVSTGKDCIVKMLVLFRRPPVLIPRSKFTHPCPPHSLLAPPNSCHRPDIAARPRNTTGAADRKNRVDKKNLNFPY
jgi:hypothetical protein